MEAGAAGVIVSNHGARQLDYAPATISVLEEVTHSTYVRNFAHANTAHGRSAISCAMRIEN